MSDWRKLAGSLRKLSSMSGPGRWRRRQAVQGLAMLVSNCISPNSTGKGFSLRLRENRDAVALLTMFNQPQCKQAMVLDPFNTAEEIQAWLDGHAPGCFDLVATQNDRAIGFAGLYPCPGAQSHSGWMCLFIHDNFHGRGAGSLLLRALLATADLVAGLSRVQLIVHCDNDRAISLYRKFGFEIEGRHASFARRGDQFIDAFTMARLTARIPAGPPALEQIEANLRSLLALQQSAHSRSV